MNFEVKAILINVIKFQAEPKCGVCIYTKAKAIVMCLYFGFSPPPPPAFIDFVHSGMKVRADEKRATGMGSIRQCQQ